MIFFCILFFCIFDAYFFLSQEQQRPGVFPKTLRNMWIAVAVLNPSISLLSQCLLPVSAIASEAESGALLSRMAKTASGDALELCLIIDATTVLIGAVITAFVGFTGLAHRMALDRCLPQIFLRANKWRGTRHWIIGGFWMLTSLLVLMTQGDVEVLAGIYTLAFLTVMLLFCTGNILLKMKRRELPTETRAAWGTVLVAGLMITLGLLGNVLSRDSESLSLFLIFGVLFLLPVQFMLHRISIIRVLAVLTQDRFPSLHSRLVNKADDLANKPLIFISDDVRDFSCILLFAFLTHFFSLAG